MSQCYISSVTPIGGSYNKQFFKFCQSPQMERLKMLGSSLRSQGYWQVRGEDNSHLGVVHGSLRATIEWAVKQPGFYTWGIGRHILPYDIIEVR